MRRVSMRIGVILALLAAGAWALPVMAADDGSAPAPAADAKPPKDAAKDKKESGGEEGGENKKAPEGVSGGRFAGDPVYVHIAPMVLPVISDQGVEQLITILIDVEVRDFDVADNMHSNMPRVMDALMRSLYGGLGQGSLRNGKLVDVTKVKARATAALNEVIGDGIREVLIQGVAQRML
jgi:flagellar FliL protein